MKLYVVKISPCCRVVWLYCLQNDIKVEIEDVDVFSGEHKTENFKKMSPFSEFPVLSDGENSIYGACPILLYLGEKYSNFKCFGEDGKQNMMVKSMLSWASSELHQVLGYRVVYPNFMESYQLTGDSTEGLIEKGTKELTKMLEMMENVFLRRNKFLTGSSITVADYYVATLILQLEWLEFDFSLWPKLTNWLNTFKDLELWKKVHEKHNGFVAELKK
eukprot:TCONS_00019420-protein